MSPQPRLVDLPETTVIGLRVRAPFNELFTAVPYAWAEVFRRAPELSARLDEGFVDCSLGAQDGVYTEIIGVRVPAGTLAPDGLEAVTLPAATYAALDHRGSLRDIGESFGVLERWIAGLPEQGGCRRVHDGVKLDVGYLPDGSETGPDGAGHVLYARIGTL